MPKKQNLKSEAEKTGRVIRNSLHIKNSREFLVFIAFLVVVFLYWYLVNMSEEHESEYIFEPVLEHVPDDVIITEPLPATLTVVFRDKGEKILEYRARKTMRRLSFDYRECAPAGSHYLLTGKALRDKVEGLFATSAEIVSYAPDTLQFYTAPAMGRRLSIQLNGWVSADNEHVISTLRLVPDSVTVYAPRTVLDTLYAVNTSQVSLTQLTDTASVTLELQPPVRGALCIPSEINLEVGVSPYVEKTIELPIRSYMCPPGKAVKTFPSRAKVSFYVSLHDSRSVGAEDFELIVNWNSLGSDSSGKVRPELLRIPSGIHTVIINPEEVEYLIESSALREDPAAHVPQ